MVKRWFFAVATWLLVVGLTACGKQEKAHGIWAPVAPTGSGLGFEVSERIEIGASTLSRTVECTNMTDRTKVVAKVTVPAKIEKERLVALGAAEDKKPLAVPRSAVPYACTAKVELSTQLISFMSDNLLVLTDPDTLVRALYTRVIP